jgi:ABC-2 type transport system ATP-binding protein
VKALDNISFSIDEGELVGYIGPNGAGKSTTMRILTGYLPATSGIARVCDVPVATRPEEVKRLVGYMPENNPLPEDMRVSEYLYYRGRLKELRRRKLSSRIDEVMELCDLGRERHRIIGKLSKGFRQRVGIAEAILSEPPVIIMDEPTIGLDPHQIQLVRDLIASLRGRMSVIISSHILPEIEVTCDRVLIINQGRIVTMGTPAELRRDIIGHSLYKLEISCDLDQLGPALAHFEPTLKITETSPPDADGFRIIHLTTDRDDPIGEELMRHLSTDDRFRLRGLSREHPTLEDVFLVATRRSRDIIDAKKETPTAPRTSA